MVNMLKELCEKISCDAPYIIEEDNPLGTRIMRPEYSIYVEDRKTYPLSKTEHLFAICWCIRDKKLYGALKPSDVSFSYQYEFRKNTRSQLHTHEYLELAYIVSGTFHQRIIDKDTVFKEGDLCLVDKNCLHQDYLDSNSATILFLGIPNTILETIIADNIVTERIVSFLQSALSRQQNIQQYLHFKPKSIELNKEMNQCFYQLMQELIRNDEGSVYICHGLLMRIFQLLNNNYEFSLSKELRKKMNWMIYQEITDYIKDNYKDISIQKLTERFHFQEDYFNRLLKSNTGLTYIEYVQGIRLIQAERLLTQTDTKIDQIAAMVGYQNKGYFYKIFKDRYKMTPGMYRRIKRVGEFV
jgi:AraC-like DNA-binding protein